MDDPTDVEARVFAAVRALGVAHERIACDPEFADTAAFCARYGVAPEDSANAILVASKKPPGRDALCVVLATTALDVKRAVCAQLEVRRASFASPDEMLARTGMALGGVTVFGLPADLPIFVDARVMERPSVVVGGGSRTCKIRLAPAELRKIPGLRVVADLARPR